MAPELSIIIGTVDRPAHLERFCQSVLKYTDIPFELIIVDSGLYHCAADVLDDRITVIRQFPRKGFAAAYNTGFKAATGKYVVYLNDDCEVLPHWGIEAVRFMDKNQSVGLGAIYFSESGPNSGFFIRDWLNLPYANFGILKRSFGEQIGWIDDFLHTYGSDNSLTFKTLVAGYGVAGIPRSKVLHNPILDFNKQENMSRQAEDARNLLLKYRPLLPQMYAVQSRIQVQYA